MKKNLFIPTNVPGWVVDSKTRAILNINTMEKKLYESELEKALLKKDAEKVMDKVTKLEKLIEQLIKEK
jgi:hypothetical protein